MYLSFEVKTRVGQPAGSTTYRKFVRKFEEGTPQQWIDLLKDLEEIWTQNSMTGGTDRASTVRALVRGESAIAFEATLADAMVDVDGVATRTTTDHVATALKAVTSTVFPFRALEMQRQWMQRKMHKPVDLSTRQMAAAINRLNNALPLFPLGSTESKFSDKEVLGLLEWSLPQAWQSKFDLDGYIPSLHSKTRLIEACEAIERNNLVPEEKPPSANHSNNNSSNSQTSNKRSENRKNERKRLKKNPSKHCTVHGHNALHDSSECYTLKNQTKAGRQIVEHKANSSQPFTAKRFRKEVNMLAQKSSKRKVLELYANAVKREQQKLKKKRGKSSKQVVEELSSDSDSDSNVSIHMVTQPPKVKPGSSKSQSKKTLFETTDEESEYQKILRAKWLQDYGEPDTDATINSDKEETSKED